MDLDEAADRLYGMPPGEFTGVRDTLAKEAKARGDAALSREIAKLRRPTVVAWAVNQASRRHADELAGFLELGEELRDAWQAQDAEALADLARRRSAAVARLARLIQADAGLGQTTEIEQTLDAAMVDESAAEQVREGRLVKALSYSGFAPAPVVRPSAPRAGKKGAGGQDGTAADRKAADRERKIEERRAALAAAEETLAGAEDGLTGWRAELAEAVHEHDERAERVAELSAELTKAKDALDSAATRLSIAKREETRARRAADAAREKAAQARAALGE